MTWQRLSLALVLGTLILGGCDSKQTDTKDSDSKQESAHHHGPHGGHLIEVGQGVAFLEVLHDQDLGSITLHVLGADGQSPQKLEKAPQLKLLVDQNPKVLETAAQGDDGATFSVTDESLKGCEAEGRVTIELDGKTYNPDLVHHHH